MYQALLTGGIPPAHLHGLRGVYIAKEYKENASGKKYELGFGYFIDSTIVMPLYKGPGGTGHDMVGGDESKGDSMGHFQSTALHEVGHLVGDETGEHYWGEKASSLLHMEAATATEVQKELWDNGKSEEAKGEDVSAAVGGAPLEVRWPEFGGGGSERDGAGGLGEADRSLEPRAGDLELHEGEALQRGQGAADAGGGSDVAGAGGAPEQAGQPVDRHGRAGDDGGEGVVERGQELPAEAEAEAPAGGEVELPGAHRRGQERGRARVAVRVAGEGGLGAVGEGADHGEVMGRLVLLLVGIVVGRARQGQAQPGLEGGDARRRRAEEDGAFAGGQGGDAVEEVAQEVVGVAEGSELGRAVGGRAPGARGHARPWCHGQIDQAVVIA